MSFRNRTEAGQRLAQALAPYSSADPVILALPRGGVAVAAEVARALGAPLDLILVRKLGVPTQPELAMGAVVDGGEPVIVRNEDVIAITEISEEAFKRACDSELAEIERRRKLYLKDRPRAELKDRVVIVVDDGIATGATMRAALQAVRKRKPKMLILAVPVAPASTLEELRDEVDDIVCLEAHELFIAIGIYYVDFGQVSDDEVIDILSKAPAPVPAQKAQVC